MRGKFRKVKDKLSKRRKDSIVEASRTNSDDSEIDVRASFLGLPAELRNDIYQYLAESTTLTLSPASPKKRPTPIGILLACRQTWQEYRAILMTQASFVISVAEYNFGSVVRTFEKLNTEDLALMKMNPNLWICLQLGHVPGRDDRKALRAWCDYRGETVLGPYFGSGQRVPRDMIFQYDVMFLHHMRPPRPPSRYANGYQMRMELLRAHVRMASRLHPPDTEVPSVELQKIRDDLGERVKILEELSAEVIAAGS